jgi:NTP pyrophosphatase (non-canonical NTP hydrolase)
MAKWSVYDEEEDMINETDIDAFARTSDFNWFQSECQKTAIYPKQQGLAYTALGLASEAGEYCSKVKKGIRDGEFDDKAAALELFDVLWYVAMSAHELGYDLEEIAHMGVRKLQDRQQRGVLSGNGDYR